MTITDQQRREVARPWLAPSEALRADAERFSSRYFESFKKAANRHGTCIMTYCADMSHELRPTVAFTCSACSLMVAYSAFGYRFCPYCGARIERFECLEGDVALLVEDDAYGACPSH